MVEALAKLELAIYTTGNTLRERRRLLLETGRFERREGSEWKLEGIEFRMNERVYGGVRQSTGEIGRNWMPAPAALAQINHDRYQYAHGLGMLLAIRLRWRFEEGFDLLSLTGKNLLALADIPYSDRRASPAWTTLRRTLDALASAGLLHDYGWKDPGQAWTLAGVCHMRAAHWLTDRATRGLLPVETPPAPDRPFTGAELLAWRKARGWTQREAAVRLGVSQVAVHKAEANPTEGLGHKLRKAFRQIAEESPIATDVATSDISPRTTSSTAPDRPFTGAELLAWRKAQGWTQREAAVRLGVSHVAVHKAETRPAQGLGCKLREAFRRVTEESTASAL
jgi:transcriptional regulator with XRE-family HTH domain